MDALEQPTNQIFTVTTIRTFVLINILYIYALSQSEKKSKPVHRLKLSKIPHKCLSWKETNIFKVSR